MALLIERKPLIEQVTEDDIDYDENPTTGFMLRIMTASYKDLDKYCSEEGISQADFIEHAIQRELDFRNGELRYIIKDVMSRIYREE